MNRNSDFFFASLIREAVSTVRTSIQLSKFDGTKQQYTKQLSGSRICMDTLHTNTKCEHKQFT